MENKKLLILVSIRQPMADHSNKVTHMQTHTLYVTIDQQLSFPFGMIFVETIIRMYLCVSQVKKRVVQVISAMAHHGYLELEGGELLVRFIVQHCALPDTYQVQLLLDLTLISGFV